MRIPPLGRAWLIVIWLLGSAIGLSTPAPSSELSLGSRHFAAGDYAAAEEAFTRALTLNRSDPALYHNRALARFNQQKFAEAKADLSAYIALRPKDAAAFALRASICFLLDDAAGALADADAALAGDPGNADARLVRGRARIALGQTEGALEDFARLLQSQPSNAGALIGRGDVFLARGEVAKAKVEFARAFALAPSDPDAGFKLGLAHFRLLEFADAGRILATAAALSPESPLVARTLGYAQYAAGNHAAAATAFTRAIALDPTGAPYARLALFLAERRLGNSATAPDVGSSDAPGDEWPRLIARYLRAEITEDYLLLAAQNLNPVEARSGRMCEAHFYIGSQYLLAGNTESARDQFEEAIASAHASYAEHVLAHAELARLKDAPSPPKRKSLRRP